MLLQCPKPFFIWKALTMSSTIDIAMFSGSAQDWKAARLHICFKQYWETAFIRNRAWGNGTGWGKSTNRIMSQWTVWGLPPFHQPNPQQAGNDEPLMSLPPLTCISPACNHLNDTTAMLEHTLSTYCNSQTAEQETWKETEQEKLKVFLTACAHTSQATVWTPKGCGGITAGNQCTKSLLMGSLYF